MVISGFDFTGMRIEKLHENHNTSEFSCGVKEYDDFLKKEALGHQEEKICDTYILLKADKVVAYASMCPHSIRINEDERKKYAKISGRKVYDHYPALKITRLARDVKWKGSGIGRLMIFCAVILAKEKSGVASYGRITLDAEPDKIGYYQDLGFKIAAKYKGRRKHIPMYVNIDKIYNLVELDNGLKARIKSLFNLN